MQREFAHSRRGTALFAVLAAVFLALLVGGCGAEPKAPRVLQVTTGSEEGATISIGGVVYGESPQTIRGLKAGRAYVIAEKEGFKRNYQQVEIPEAGEISVDIPLEPFTGMVSVNTEPPGAEVFFDDVQSIGVTPLQQANVPIGDHSFTLRLENHEPLSFELAIETDHVYSKTFILKPLMAELKVLSRPSGGEIRLNEELQEDRTPAIFSLIPGIYTVSVYLKGYITGEAVVDLAPNSSVTEELTLEQGFVPRGMVLVPEGEFTFGSDTGAPDERPMRKMTLPAYYIDKYEVTNAEYKRAVPSHEFQPGDETMPVRGISWRQAEAYAVTIGKRLPTEAEWEKAARGADGREWPWGNTFDPALCNSKKETHSRAEKVGARRLGASPFGCMDMAGNVYEWTSDWYQAYPGNTAIQTDYGQVFRVLRGGSYQSPAFDVRAVRRYFDKMDSARADYGFRCAMDVTPRDRAPAAATPATPTPKSP